MATLLTVLCWGYLVLAALWLMLKKLPAELVYFLLFVLVVPVASVKALSAWGLAKGAGALLLCLPLLPYGWLVWKLSQTGSHEFARKVDFPLGVKGNPPKFGLVSLLVFMLALLAQGIAVLCFALA